MPVECNPQSTPDITRRFRQEFLNHYPTPLSSDAFSDWSSSYKEERDANDTASLSATTYLVQVLIPAFVKRGDAKGLERFHSLSQSMHFYGINLRYCGYILAQSKVPAIKDACIIEMVARTAKGVFASRMRSAILHFKNVGATLIDEEMKGYACTLFSLVLGVNDKSYKVLLASNDLIIVLG